LFLNEFGERSSSRYLPVHINFKTLFCWVNVLTKSFEHNNTLEILLQSQFENSLRLLPWFLDSISFKIIIWTNKLENFNYVYNFGLPGPAIFFCSFKLTLKFRVSTMLSRYQISHARFKFILKLIIKLKHRFYWWLEWSNFWFYTVAKISTKCTKSWIIFQGYFIWQSCPNSGPENILSERTNRISSNTIRFHITMTYFNIVIANQENKWNSEKPIYSINCTKCGCKEENNIKQKRKAEPLKKLKDIQTSSCNQEKVLLFKRSSRFSYFFCISVWFSISTPT